jgi:hypothetical protein
MSRKNKISASGPDRIRIQFEKLIQIGNPEPDPGRLKLATQKGKNVEISCLKV